MDDNDDEWPPPKDAKDHTQTSKARLAVNGKSHRGLRESMFFQTPPKVAVCVCST